MRSQTAIASQIYNASADYVLALKANHPTLHGQVKAWFDQAFTANFEGITFSYDERVEKGHHRTEKRQVWTVPISQLPPLHQQADWLGLKTIVMVVRVRHLWNKITREVQFYLTSLNSDACKLGQAIRLHWGVENGLHWTLDQVSTKMPVVSEQDMRRGKKERKTSNLFAGLRYNLWISEQNRAGGEILV